MASHGTIVRYTEEGCRCYKCRAARVRKTAYMRAYNEINKAKWVLQQKTRKARNRAYVRRIKAKTPCADCGKSYPSYVMDFDHVPGCDKLWEIGRLSSTMASLETIDKEIAKCDIVCANCHRIREHKRRRKQSG